MKKIGLLFLALVLTTVVILPAWAAVDVKFSGSFYAAGIYQDKSTVNKNFWISGSGTSSDPYVYHMPVGSTAFYYQRLRVSTSFIVSPGLILVTRFDAMERVWGATRSAPGTATMTDSAGTRAENENIAFDLAYVHYKSAIGEFKVGYQEKGNWGTEFANNLKPTGEVYWGYYIPKAYTYIWLMIAKVADNSLTSQNAATTTDLDNDEYMLGIHFYGIKNVEIALLYDYLRYASGRNGYRGWAWDGTQWVWSDYGYVSAAHLLEPYIKAKFGPVKLEAEVDYAWGDYVKYDGLHPYFSDMKLSNLQAYLKAVADFGIVYVGGIAAYVAGDDPGTNDKFEGGYLNGGREFKPCLILFNSDRSDWAGNINGYNGSAINGPMRNAWLFQVLAGVRPVEKLDIMATVTYANADKKPSAAWLYNHYGTEVDLTATYQITKNLSYMLGGGYLFVGKYFKGISELNELQNDFMAINKLLLTF